MANFLLKIVSDEIAKKIIGMRFLKDNPVYVGIPEDTTERENENNEINDKKKVGITNADLLFIHSNGSAVNNIPARPWIEPAIAEDKDKICKYLKQAVELAINGNEAKAIDYLSKAGMEAQNFCRSWPDNSKNNWDPLSAATISERIKKGSMNPVPLVDTGELRKSITYFIDHKGTRQK